MLDATAAEHSTFSEARI